MTTAPTLRFSIGSTVAPGDRLGSVRSVSPGMGTYARGGHVYASVVGKLGVQADKRATDTDTDTATEPPASTPSLPIVSICLPNGSQLSSYTVLLVGQLVLGKIVRIIMQQAVVNIVAAEGVGALSHSHAGAVRREDIRSGASDELKIVDAFRPNDIVLCRILSLGDSRRYYLTTAEPELGVVRAKSATSGCVMQPVSWKEMECPETKSREPRKCAKPTDLAEVLSISTSL